MATQELYNSRILAVYCKLIRARYPGLDLERLSQQCDIRLSEIDDEGHWFSQAQVNAFYNAAVAGTGNPQIAREAGRFAASANALGVLRQYALSAFGPKRMFQTIGRFSAKIARSSDYECTCISDNAVELTVTPRPGVREEAFQCENRIGFFECGVMLFNYNMPGIKHSECVFRGDAACRYEISWDSPPSVRWRKLRNKSTWAFLPTFAVALAFDPMMAFSVLSPIMFVALAAINFIGDIAEKAELRDSLIQTSDVTEKLVDQVSITYNNAKAVKEIAAVLKRDSTIDNILSEVTEVLKSRLEFERCAILLANHDQTQLAFRNGYGYSKEQLVTLADLSFHLDKPDSTGFLVRCFRDNKPMLINEVESHFPELTERSRTVASQLNVRSLICCPICVEEKPIGVLMMDNPISERPLVQTDLSLIEGVAPSIGTSLHNVNLLKEQGDQFETLLQVMSASIDARDSLTRGHSERVTEFALAICRVMNLDQDFSESVRVAALLHDYGKLAIADKILKKPGKLTPAEYDEIKTHAEKTGDILRQINFGESLSNVPMFAVAHHEKLDGSGYPYGLKGDEIPLGARIIAVADIFEALTAKRHYRESLPTEIALEIIRKDVDNHYDPEVFAALESFLQDDVFSNDKGDIIDIEGMSSILAL